VGILVVTGDYKGRSGIKALYELSKVTTLPYIIYKLFTVAIFTIVQFIYPKSSFTVDAEAKRYKIPIHHVVSIKSKAAIDWIELQKPDLIVSVSCPQMIGKKILSLPKLGGINIHASLLPAYAGLAPYYWVLANGLPETGITVHYMTLKFDQGNILAQKKYPVAPHSNAFKLFYELSVLGGKALFEGVEKALNGDGGTPQDLSQYSYFSNPDDSSYKRLKQNKNYIIHLADFFHVIRMEISKNRN
jgi:methionyl-tRNA formyltransferase